MTNLLDTAKGLKTRMLQNRVRNHLQKNHDWKVSKSVSSGVPLSASDINYRNSIIAEYNQRIALINRATTFEEINNVDLQF